MEFDNVVVVYVAGALRGNIFKKFFNFRKVHKLCKKLWLNNIAAYSPHKNSGWLDSKETDKFVILANIEMMLRCDILLVADNWEKSVGTLNEMAVAQLDRMPIYVDINKLINDINNKSLVNGIDITVDILDRRDLH